MFRQDPQPLRAAPEESLRSGQPLRREESLRRQEVSSSSDPILEQLPRAALEEMLAAGSETLECMRVLEKVDLNLVSEVLRGHEAFFELEHYPTDDVFDVDSHSQYYYHAHRELSGEHGHFHLFLRGPGMPADARRVPYTGAEPWPEGDDSIAHLIAISMDAYGRPIGLFTTNRWVTAEAWYRADDVIRMLDRFRIDHAHPSWPVNRWITAMLRLFRPQIESLIRRRVETMREWIQAHPGVDAFEDRALEITSELDISIEQQIARVRRATTMQSGCSTQACQRGSRRR